jgi:hypothetical protein
VLDNSKKPIAGKPKNKSTIKYNLKQQGDIRKEKNI